MPSESFRDRREAGRVLASLLAQYTQQPDVVVLALPRGGVPVGYEVARTLRAPLDVFLVRKLGLPGHEELAMGAIASGGVRVVNEDLLARLGSAIGNLNPVIDQVAAAETIELHRREITYRDDRPAPDLDRKTVIVVDDGLATGATMRAAVRALKQRGVARIVVAVPVGSPDTCDELRSEADEVVCAITPQDFAAVGQFYDDFSQTTDDEVREFLALAAEQFSVGRGK